MPYPLPTANPAPLDDIIMESLTANALIAALDSGLFDALHAGPATPETLAQTLGFQAAPLASLLDLLVVRRVLDRDGDHYSNTAMAEESLASSSPLFQGTALSFQLEYNRRIQDRIPELLRGEGDERSETDSCWSQTDVMEGTRQHSLNGQVQMATRYLADLPEFNTFRAMADVGGGSGHYSRELLERNPDLTSTVFDLPAVVQAAGQRTGDDLDGRLRFQAFDLLSEQLPDQAFDLVLVSHVLYACSQGLGDTLSMLARSLKPGGLLATHHFSSESGASPEYRSAVEFVTRLTGYESHHLSRTELEQAMAGAGLAVAGHTFTGMDGQTLLLTARRP